MFLICFLFPFSLFSPLALGKGFIRRTLLRHNDNTRDVGDNSHDSEGTTATNLALNTALVPIPASNVTNNTATLEHAIDNTRDIGDTFTATIHPQILTPKQ